MFPILYRVQEKNLTIRVHGYEAFECRITSAPLLLTLKLELTVSAHQNDQITIQSKPEWQ